MNRNQRKQTEFMLALTRTLFQTLAFIFVLLTFLKVSRASTKEEIESILMKNHSAITVARRVINEYPNETQWYLLLNSHGYLTPIPVSKVAKQNYDEKFKRQFERLRQERKLRATEVQT